MSGRSSPDADGWRLLQYPDLPAGVFSLFCLLGLVGIGAPLGAAVTVPLLVYASLRLLEINAVVSAVHTRADRWMARESEVKACQRLAGDLRSRVGEADDREVAARLRQILDCADRSLAVIEEDQREDAAGHVISLLETTNQLVSAYLRLVRRELASDESRTAFLGNLDTLAAAFNAAWLRMNREAIVTLGTLSDMIDVSLVPQSSTLIAASASPRSWKSALSRVNIASGRQS